MRLIRYQLFCFLLFFLLLHHKNFAQTDTIQWPVHLNLIVYEILNESNLKLYDPSSGQTDDAMITEEGIQDDENDKEQSTSVSSSEQSNLNLGFGFTSFISPDISVYNLPVFLRYQSFSLKINTPFVQRQEKFLGKKYKKSGIGDLSAQISYKTAIRKKRVFIADWEDYQKTNKKKIYNSNFMIQWPELEDVQYYLVKEYKLPGKELIGEYKVVDADFIQIKNRLPGKYSFRVFAVFNDNEMIESDIYEIEIKKRTFLGIYSFGIQFPTGKADAMVDDYFVPLGSGSMNFFSSVSVSKSFRQWVSFFRLGYKYTGIYKFKTLIQDTTAGYNLLTSHTDHDGSQFNLSLGTNYYGLKRFPIGGCLQFAYNSEGYTEFDKTLDYLNQTTHQSGQYDNYDNYMTLDLLTQVSYRLFGFINCEFKLLIPIYSQFNEMMVNKPKRSVAFGFGINFTS